MSVSTHEPRKNFTRSSRAVSIFGLVCAVAFSCSSQNSNPASNAGDGGLSTGDDGGATNDGSLPTDSGGNIDGSQSDAAASAHLLADAGLRVGAWVNPTTDGGFPPTTLAGLETYLGRNVDLSLHYQAMAETFPTMPETDDATHGRIPVISMDCNIANVLTGSEDAAFNQRLAEYVAYGKPILLRYCWEMNINTPTIAPADFISAWQRLHGLAVTANAANLYWFFCPAHDTGVTYYPGDAYVDYAGFDVYDRTGDGLEATLQPSYAAYASIEKPFIVGETGARPDLNQATFLDGNARTTLSTKFPKIVAVDYFDGAGQTDWSFSDAGVASFKKFAE